MEQLNRLSKEYKSEYTEMKHLNWKKKKKIPKAKNSILKLKKNCRKLKDSKIKIMKKLEDPFTKPLAPLLRPRKSFYQKVYLHKDPEVRILTN